MADIFGEFSNVSDKDAVPVSKAVCSIQPKRTRKKKDAKIHKIVKKEVKKQIKRLKAAEEKEAAEKAAAEKAAIKKDVKQFFFNIGKAVCKALPGILTLLATTVIGRFFGVSPKEKGWQPA